MERMHLFLDTHDVEKNTFPSGLTEEQFRGFFTGYEEACRAEGVVLLEVNLGLAAGRAFCLTMATDAEAVRRAHTRAGLPFDSITEVRTASPGALFFDHVAA